MRPLGSDTIVIVRAPLITDPRDGSEYRDWNNATSTPISQCMVEPFMLAEKLNFEENRDREYARTALRIYAPPGTDIDINDRVEFEDHTYDVFGHPGRWRRFNGVERYVSVIGRIREG